nr:replication initiator protein A [Pseudomonadota bacterium]
AIKFSGHHLTQSDADVWIQVIDLMKNKKFGADGKIKIKRSALLALLEWGRSGQNYSKLLTSFKRLVESTFYIESKEGDESEKKKSQPLRMFEYVQDGDWLTLWIPKESMPLFSRMSIINWSARLALGARMGLAKAIQIYASSVAYEESHSMRLAELKEITSYKSPDAKFAALVSRAFKELEAVGILKDGWVEKEYGVWMCGWRYNNVI